MRAIPVEKIIFMFFMFLVMGVFVLYLYTWRM